MRTLDSLCQFIVDCPHSTAPDEGVGFPLIRTPNIERGYFNLEGVHRVSKDAYDKRNIRAVPQDDDLILAREAPAGNVAIVQNGNKVCLGQRTVLIRPDSKKVHPMWLNYYLNAPEQRHALLKNANGATVPHVNMPIIRSLPVVLPNRKTQECIAGILSAYDKLIENNRKQIKLLEEAAQRLYKEWFIDLKFPGHETTPIDPTTNLPEGWRAVKFSSFVSIMSGGTPSTRHREYYDGSIPFIGPADCHGGFFAFDTAKHITQNGLENCNSSLYAANTIVLTARGTVGEVVLLAQPMAMNQSCFALKCDELSSPFFLFFSVREKVASLKAMANGGVFDTIVLKTFERISLLRPEIQTVRLFEEKVAAIMHLIRSLSEQAIAAQEARDRLLPKLMSGEIEV